jgi:hypothetical protein
MNELLEIREQFDTATDSARPSAAPVLTKEIVEMLMYEELARARIQDLRTDMRDQNVRGHARAARRWERMAQWAARRAHRHRT